MMAEAKMLHGQWVGFVGRFPIPNLSFTRIDLKTAMVRSSMKHQVPRSGLGAWTRTFHGAKHAERARGDNGSP